MSNFSFKHNANHINIWLRKYGGLEVYVYDKLLITIQGEELEELYQQIGREIGRSETETVIALPNPVDYSDYEGYHRVPKCYTYRMAHKSVVCTSVYCERCARYRMYAGFPPLTLDSVMYADKPSNIVLGED